MIIKYFISHAQTLEDLKAEYKKLAMLNHPDRGGNTSIMQTINNEYDFLFNALKSYHRNADGEIYEKDIDEVPEYWRNIISSLIALNMIDVTIEIIGSFVWLTGHTRPYKDVLKGLGYKWSKNKSSWYLPPLGYRKRSRNIYTLNDLRDTFDSHIINHNNSENNDDSTNFYNAALLN